MTLVIDASMALAWIFERSKAEEAVLADEVLLQLGKVDMLVPPLWHTEIANALLLGERRRVVSEAQLIDFLNRLSLLPIATDDAMPGSRRDMVMALAREYGLTAYDASYLELALRRGATMATFDGKLADAMRKAGGLVFGDHLA